MVVDAGWLKEHIRDIPEFPQPGVTFKDITPLLAHAEGFAFTVDALAGHVADRRIDAVVGIEARGFILAAPVAYRLGAAFVPIRKAGKLPGEVVAKDYALEYGTGTLEMHADALHPGQRVLVIDDVLATGGTAEATGHLVQDLGAELVSMGFVIELAFLGGRRRLPDIEAVSLITYD